MKLRCAILQRLGLKGVKIDRNVSKFGVHACLSNGHPNLWSNLNCKKIVKSETSSCIFSRVRLKAGPNSSKHYKTWRAHLYIKQASKSMIKFQFWEFGQKWNSVMRFQLLFDHSCRREKIAPNLIKIGVHAYFWNGYLNLL